jgi:hypothetical protein
VPTLQSGIAPLLGTVLIWSLFAQASDSIPELNKHCEGYLQTSMTSLLGRFETVRVLIGRGNLTGLSFQYNVDLGHPLMVPEVGRTTHGYLWLTAVGLPKGGREVLSHRSSFQLAYQPALAGNGTLALIRALVNEQFVENNLRRLEAINVASACTLLPDIHLLKVEIVLDAVQTAHIINRRLQAESDEEIIAELNLPERSAVEEDLGLKLRRARLSENRGLYRVALFYEIPRPPLQTIGRWRFNANRR